MMHIIKNFFHKLTFKVFSGGRVPKWSAKSFGQHAPAQPEKTVDGRRVQKKEYMEQMVEWKVKMKKYDERRAEWATAVAGSPAELLLVIMIEKVNAVRLPPLSGVGDMGGGLFATPLVIDSSPGAPSSVWKNHSWSSDGLNEEIATASQVCMLGH